MRKQNSRLTLAVALVAATMLIAGGVAIASNTGFKINKPLAVRPANITSQVGNNWTAIPFFNPYANGAGICAQLGLASTGTRATLLKIDPVGGAATNVLCGTPAANAFTWFQGQGIRIQNGGVAPTSAIIVGSHNPAATLTIPASGNGNIGNLWLGVPYHTTAVTAQNLCDSIGMNNAGSRGTVGRLNAVSGAFTNVQCGTAAAGALNLVLGEAVRLRNPVAITFVPAHF
jgi:hypothetical protein